MLIVLTAWTVIGLAMLFDRSVAELFVWVGPLILRFQDRWDEYWDARKTKQRKRRTAIQSETGALKQEERPIRSEAASEDVEEKAAEEFSPDLESGVEEKVEKAWVLPDIEKMLEAGSDFSINEEFDKQRGRLIEETLASLGAPGQVVEINRGPTITQFGVEPDYIQGRSGRTRVRVSKIAGLAKDLALALAAGKVRVQAPVPGKGFVGIEVPNEETSVVALRDVIESDIFKKIKES